MGTSVASVQNDAGSSFSISCPAGQEDVKPTIQYQTTHNPRPKVPQHGIPVVIATNGKGTDWGMDYQAESDEGLSIGWEAYNTRVANDLNDLTQELKRAKTLTLYISGKKTDSFSTVGADKALSKLLDGCLDW